MQNHTFWCILGSENWQLLTGADTEGTARRRGLGGEGGGAGGIDVKGPEPKTLKASSFGEWGRGFRLPNRLRSMASVVSSPSGVQDGTPPENGFQCFQMSQNASFT